MVRDVFDFLTMARYPAGFGRIQKEAFKKKCARYRIVGGDLFLIMRRVKKRCITQDEVADLLRSAHDLEGHYQAGLTLRKLAQYYWPTMAEDVNDYIKGCMKCAKHGTALRSQSLSPIYIDSPNQLLGIDFIGPFPKTVITIDEFLKASWPQVLKDFDFKTVDYDTSLAFTHVLLVVDYFSRFVWAFPCTADSQDEVIRCMRWLYSITGAAVGAYTDEGRHFAGEKIQEWFKTQGTIWVPSPVASKKSTGLAEKCNDLLQRILKKITIGVQNWPIEVQPSAFELNRRFIMHLGHTPYEIQWGYQPPSALEINFPTHSRLTTVEFLKGKHPLNALDNDTMCEAVFSFMVQRIETKAKVKAKSRHIKQREKARYDRGVKERLFTAGDYVMLYDHKSAKKKLHAAYRGPFVVTGFAGEHDKSYTLRQIDGTPIPRSYAGDQLKLFKPRTGHLVTGYEESLKEYQNIRAGRAIYTLPKEVREMESKTIEVLIDEMGGDIKDQVLGFYDLEELLSAID